MNSNPEELLPDNLVRKESAGFRRDVQNIGVSPTCRGTCYANNSSERPQRLQGIAGSGLSSAQIFRAFGCLHAHPSLGACRR
jgi:hypothetical protein